ncbi:hypothetical protein ACSSS7_003022 [Eimeria intestinalis]
MAIGELADAVKLRLLPYFEQGFKASSLTPSVLDARITQRLYDWTIETNNVSFSSFIGDSSRIVEGPSASAYTSLQVPPDIGGGALGKWPLWIFC